MSETLQSQLNDKGVLTITMNRPEVHNAFDNEQIVRMITALETAESSPEVRVVIIASEGKSFSAGGDINYMKQMGNNSYQENLDDAAQLAKLMKTLNFLAKPTIAKVQGAAMGGGVGLVSCCDFAIGTKRTKMALSEVKLGMAPATIAPYVVRTIGERAARRLFISAQTINAQRAFELGFLSAVVAEEELDAAVDQLANSLLNNAPHGMQLAKQAAHRVASGVIDEDLISYTTKLIADIRDSDEGKEGLSAFLEKRSPNWIEE